MMRRTDRVQRTEWPAEMATGEIWPDDDLVDLPTPEELERERELVRADEAAERYAAYLEGEADSYSGADDEGADDCDDF